MAAAHGALRSCSREVPYAALAKFPRLITEPQPDIVIPETILFFPLVETNRNHPENSLQYLFDTAARQLAVRGSETPDVASLMIQGRSRARVLRFDPHVATHSRFSLALATNMKDLDAW